MRASRLVHDRIQYLAVSRQREASETLTSLLADPSLSLWHEDLPRARDSQLVVHRDAHYHYPDVAQVCETLNGGTPANPGDLAALVVDWLHEIATQIRDGNTDGWKMYWNVDPQGHPTNPRPENNCRDTLLYGLRNDLRRRLPNVDAQPEGQYADDKRADIRIACRGFQVPVEIKKDLAPGCLERSTKPTDRTIHTRPGYGRIRNLSGVLVRQEKDSATAFRGPSGQPRRDEREARSDALTRSGAQDFSLCR